MSTLREATGLMMATSRHKSERYPWITVTKATGLQPSSPTKNLRERRMVWFSLVILGSFLASLIFLDAYRHSSISQASSMTVGIARLQLHSHGRKVLELRDSLDPFKGNSLLIELQAAKVIPDVLDEFQPSLALSVSYNGVPVYNGLELTVEELTPYLTGSSPNISIGGGDGELYTMIMSDPDAPNPEDPTAAEYCHWLWVNLPGGSIWGSGVMPPSGDELFKYIPPSPPVGLHRYVISIFKQAAQVDGTPLEERAGFTTRAFAESRGLGNAVAAMYFVARLDINGQYS